MKHKCKSKQCSDKRIFRFDTDGKPTKIGAYGTCRICKCRVKILTLIPENGRVRDVVMKFGDVIKTAGGDITYEKEEEASLKEEIVLHNKTRPACKGVCQGA